MKIRLFSFLLATFLFISCQNDDEKRLAEQQKDAKAREVIFNNINNGWNFQIPTPSSPVTQSQIVYWTALRDFVAELNKKPKSSIGAFQKKAKELSKKAKLLGNNIPPKFNKPEIKSRVSVLLTKINSIDLFINLDAIPDQKVLASINDANTELNALYREMDEIVRKSEIPKEEGESDMIRMLDTTRAIPSTPARPASLNRPFKKGMQ